MKKFMSVILAGALVLSVAGCERQDDSSVEEHNATVQSIIDEIDANESKYASAADALSAIWDEYEADFPVYGGSVENPVDGAPGAVDVSDKDLLKNTLLIPDGMEVTEAATVVHMMNGNTFTAAAIKVEGMDKYEASTALLDSFLSTQFVCGVPDRIAIGDFYGYIIIVYGEDEIIDSFKRVASEICLEDTPEGFTLADAYYVN